MDGFDINGFIASVEKDFKPKALEAAREAVLKFSLNTIGEAAKVCPKDTGFLAASGTVEQEPSPATACLAGFNADYAVFVHENMDAAHKKGTHAKFLEVAVHAELPKLPKFVQDEMNKRFG